MRIIVVGAGKVGTALCRSLVEEKHDVILIEEKELNSDLLINSIDSIITDRKKINGMKENLKKLFSILKYNSYILTLIIYSFLNILLSNLYIFLYHTYFVGIYVIHVY